MIFSENCLLYFQHIDEISFQSSCFNSDINKLVSVVIRGVEVTNNVEQKRSVVVETILKPLLSKQNSFSTREEITATSGLNSLSHDLSILDNKKLLDFRDKKLPPSLIMFAQVRINFNSLNETHFPVLCTNLK